MLTSDNAYLNGIVLGVSKNTYIIVRCEIDFQS